MCDVAHAAMVEQVEQDARARWVVAALMDGEQVSPGRWRGLLEDELDSSGDEVPEGMDPEQWELRKALGVA